MPISNLQIFNAINAYDKQKRIPVSSQQKKTAESPVDIDEESASIDTSNQTVDSDEKDENT